MTLDKINATINTNNKKGVENMKQVLNSYYYKTFLIWKYEDGYTTDADEKGRKFKTLKSVKDFINQELSNGNWIIEKN